MDADAGLSENERIFGFASHAQSPCFHVGEDVLHDLPKVRRTQWIVAKIVAVAPATGGEQEEEEVEEERKEQRGEEEVRL